MRLRLLPIEYAVRNLGRSPSRLTASVLGSALVVTLVLAAGGFVRGMQQSMEVRHHANNVLVLGAGSEESIERSQIARNVPTLLAASVPGIRRRLDVDYVSPEVSMALVVKRAADSHEELSAVVRGVTETAFLVHPEVSIVEGRAPRAGADELIVGRYAATRLGVDADDLAVGEQLWFDHHAWRIVGRFAAPNSVMDAEIWTSLADLQIATKRDTLSCVVATLGSAEFADVDVWCAQRLDLELVAMREADYYAGLLAFYGPVRAMVWATACLIGLGGLFGGLNTMHAAFAGRVRELAALQTLGYPRRAIVVSFLVESMLAAAAGGILAAIFGLVVLDGIAVRFSMGAFAIVMDAPVLLIGLAAGVAISVVGVIPALWQCLRLPIVEALRTEGM
ncbi:MAG: ABC transporter permease [Phycisphaerales bacterium]|nr:ABC transporter permease [Phycisphaerales bacterium]MCB9855457.1 ABC transporter permease [Phycisphaerales bacterium]MCB9864233.1 ABC transporter permease [Phycisphaerales bacterium]